MYCVSFATTTPSLPPCDLPFLTLHTLIDIIQKPKQDPHKSAESASARIAAAAIGIKENRRRKKKDAGPACKSHENTTEFQAPQSNSLFAFATSLTTEQRSNGRGILCHPMPESVNKPSQLTPFTSEFVGYRRSIHHYYSHIRCVVQCGHGCAKGEN